MSRYIDADALMDALNVFKDRKNGNEHFMYGIETAKELLGIQPTVDAVPVVRCKDCIEYRDCVGACHYFNYEPTDEMDFCSHGIRADGERRTDEQQT